MTLKHSSPSPALEKIERVLARIVDAQSGKDVLSLGWVKDLHIHEGCVHFKLKGGVPYRREMDLLRQHCAEALGKIPGVTEVNIEFTAADTQAEATPVLPGVKTVIAVASGKGGVGKSTVAANLALALQEQKRRIGLLDCDIYGPSIPTMFGIHEQPEMTQKDMIVPPQRYGIQLMSIGFLATEKTPLIWRGPMVHNLLQQFLHLIRWDNVDYLILDLPPGTGDAQLTLTQSATLAGAIIVTTPQKVSLIDARKGLKMFDQVHVPVLGIVENMSYFECPECSHRTEVFRSGGGETEANELGVPFLGRIPLDPEVVIGGDEGEPIFRSRPNSKAGQAFANLAVRVIEALEKGEIR
ncbi:MAG: Mrp/NBP35 family ATP-binding protein [Candidatus Omnitrophica bacterium]|nr:Mrp/NBP35 family ATP-binding protein [Candidatus Omnitrophota bacterium]